MIVPNKMSRRDLLICLFVLLVAALPRFAAPEVIVYRQDQADLATLAQDMVAGVSVPLLGIPSSAGLPNSPITVYIVTIPYLISDSPVFATLFVALLNVIAVGLLWLLAHRYFGAVPALVAALAYAVNPWAVGFSRDLWAQDYLAPFFLLALLFGLLGFLEGKRWAQVACLPVFLFAVQIHFAAWALLPVYIWLVWVGRKRVSRRALVLSGALSLLVLAPFIIGILQLLAVNPDFMSSIEPVRRDFTPRELIKPYGQMIWLMTGLGIEQYTAREQAAELVAAVNVPTILWTLLGAATLWGVAVARRRLPRALSVFLLLWAFLPLVAFTLPLTGVVPFYFIASIPALALLAGLSVAWAWEKLHSRAALRVALAGALAAVFATQFWWTLGALNFVDSTYTSGQFGFGTPIHYLEKVRGELRQRDNIILVGAGDWLRVTASGARVWASLLRGEAACVRDLLIEERFAVLPDSPFSVAFTPQMPANSLLEQLYQTDNATEIALRPGEGSYQIHDFDSAPDWPGISSMDSLRFDNGVELTGYALERERVILRWKLPDAAKQNYGYAVRFLDSSSNILGQQETAFWAGANWCAGDRLLTWMDTPMPEGTEGLSVSMSRWEGGQQVYSGVVDGQGNIAASWADIPQL